MINIHNELREKFKKGDSLTFLKSVIETIKPEDMNKFTSYALKSAYDFNRYKAIEYMLSLEGRHEASLLYKIHVQRMIAEEKYFNKGINILKVICKHFDKNEVIKAIEVFKPQIYNDERKKREKELMCMILDFTLTKTETVKKTNKI